ncbi:thioredoxin family protein [Enterococcus sp. BWB1-3]|uniref:thioredoxin family protein n=1 Tax=unclassified Enterococcus TaxID=2608891 RepID=UPI001920F0CE|nr:MULTISPECIES: thioredoxin family protein [unclassified Enterococcus]MBL1227835.1 thioredoxin family protein [Enterococcus sp. BWB1-3]MCB5953374.1 thioredoxin family protein [Enterococcus sp. BWT-B8]
MKRMKLVLLAILLLVSGGFCLTHLTFADKNQEFEEISITEVESRVAKEKDMIVYFGKNSCEACRVFTPILSEAAKRSGKKILFLDGDNFATKEFSEKYNISGTPTLIIIKNGKVLRYEGVMELEETLSILET